MPKSIANQLIELTEQFRDGVDALSFRAPVEWVYNPLQYAWQSHREYLRRYANAGCKVLFLGMNPGPFGMAQTGVPFGEIASVRGYLQIHKSVAKPSKEHPKRPIEGFDCQKSEVSGRRLWGLFAKRFPTPDEFFQEHFVANYCPLVFMDEGGRNITPDKLNREDAKVLESCCDEFLQSLVAILRPETAIGVGAYAECCLKRVLGKSTEIHISKILHPSPASPAANRDWEGQATRQLTDIGIW